MGCYDTVLQYDKLGPGNLESFQEVLLSSMEFVYLRTLSPLPNTLRLLQIGALSTAYSTSNSSYSYCTTPFHRMEICRQIFTPRLQMDLTSFGGGEVRERISEKFNSVTYRTFIYNGGGRSPWQRFGTTSRVRCDEQEGAVQYGL